MRRATWIFIFIAWGSLVLLIRRGLTEPPVEGDGTARWVEMDAPGFELDDLH